MAVTLVAGTAWALIYYRWRSLVPLAVSHALLGTALHYWVFGNDLLERWLPLLGGIVGPCAPCSSNGNRSWGSLQP